MTLNEYTDANDPVMGDLPADELLAVLEEIGDHEAIAWLRKELDGQGSLAIAATDFGFQLPQILGGDAPPWQYTAHVFGYIPRLSAGTTQSVAIVDASNIVADRSLVGAHVHITLQQLRVAKYPGNGRHQILLDCGVFDQRLKERELRFSRSYNVLDGQSAGVAGDPLFSGLKVGDIGIGLRCQTVNVKNELDEEFLQVLNSGTFRHGLKLVGAAINPAIIPFTEIVAATTGAFLKRTRRNRKVQEFRMGLDFETPPFGARLALGSYLAVQVPQSVEQAFDWSAWVYLPEQAAIVSKADGKTLINHNYLAFGVQRVEPPLSRKKATVAHERP
jgi:hypothetical protein